MVRYWGRIRRLPLHPMSNRKKTMMIIKTLTTAALAAGLLGASAGVAGAEHTHSLKTGDGSCVLLAENGGEDNVQLPFASGPQDRRHTLHVLIHMGEPGEHVSIGVQGAGSDPCPGDYVND